MVKRASPSQKALQSASKESPVRIGKLKMQHTVASIPETSTKNLSQKIMQQKPRHPNLKNTTATLGGRTIPWSILGRMY